MKTIKFRLEPSYPDEFVEEGVEFRLLNLSGIEKEIEIKIKDKK